jgi:hypothetical protein
VVAEVRSGQDSRQHERIEISLGTWQIALKSAIANYLKTKQLAAENVERVNENKQEIE